MKSRSSSLRARLLAFFDANPHEELTRADIAAKFSVSLHAVDSVLSQLRQAGELEPVHAWRRVASRREVA